MGENTNLEAPVEVEESSKSLTLTADQAEGFMDLEPGDEVTFTVASKDEKAGTISLEQEPDEDKVPEPDEAEEKTLGYKRPVSTKEAPPLGPADLED